MKSILQAGAVAIALLGFSVSQSSATTYNLNGTTALTHPNLAIGDFGDFTNSNIAAGTSGTDDFYFGITSPVEVSTTTGATSPNSPVTLSTFNLFLIDNSTSTLISSDTAPTYISGSQALGFSDFLQAGVYEIQVAFADTGSAPAAYSGLLTVSETPIPATLPFLVTGLIGLWAWRRKSKGQAADMDGCTAA
ncbi:MAG: hypothetical protein ACYC5H_11815 [Methylovirgula sp.]